MSQADTYFRSSRQIRPIHPEAGAEHHPRCVEMAQVMREGVDTYKKLIGHGFTPAEINAHYQRAHDLAVEQSIRQVRHRADSLEDVIDKARIAIPNNPPLPRGLEETQTTLVEWGKYCMARAALAFDPWATQRERCLRLLRAYLDRSEMHTPSKEIAVAKVAESLPQVVQ